MTKICQNCQHHFAGAYCNNCGQSAETHKINFHFLWHDIQHGLFHVDKGLLFTSKELFTRPGNSIREFIEGKRVKHFKPISLVVILAGICGFLYHYFHINILANKIEISGSTDKEVNEAKIILANISEWIAGHYALVAMIVLPLYTAATYIAFIKSGYNFTEHFVLNAFLSGQRLILHIITFPLYYIYNGSPALRVIERCVDTLGYGLLIWALTQFFHNKKKNKILTFGQALLSLLIFFLLGYVVVRGLVYIKMH